MAINTLPNGYMLNNEYRIICMLGQGGFGITYLAEDIHLDRKVVIKEFLPQNIAGRDQNRYTVSPYNNGDKLYGHLLNRFAEEAKLLASIRHPNIVKVLRLLDANNTAYFIMNYEEGKTLEEYLQQHKRFSEEEIFSIIMPILEGTKYIHTKGILHRDIAPDNIYLNQNGMPMLIDFGAARNAIAQKSQAISSIVKEGYSPPEQYTSNTDQNASTDIYALGAVMYRMITGDVPTGSTQRQMALLGGKPDPIDNLVLKYKDQYTVSLLEAIIKALNIQQEKRFQTISDFQKACVTNSLPSKRNKWLLISIFIVIIVSLGIWSNRYLLDTTPSTQISYEIKKENMKVEKLIKDPKVNKEKEHIFSRQNVEYFLKKFIASGEKSSINKTLVYFSSTVSPYFSISSADHNAIYKDKKDYYKKWPHREYNLVSFEIINKYYTATVEYCDVTVKTRWKVSNESKHISGESISKIKLSREDDKIKIVAIKTLKTTRDIIDEIKEKIIAFQDNGIHIRFEYPSIIKKGETFILKVEMTNNNQGSVQGGLTLSFPDMTNMGGKALTNNFTTLTAFRTGEKIYSNEKKRNIPAEYFMIEGWQSKYWSYGDTKYFSVKLTAPYALQKLRINLRGILWITGSKNTRTIPAYTSKYDQQGFAVKQFSIDIQSAN